MESPQFNKLKEQFLNILGVDLDKQEEVEAYSHQDVKNMHQSKEKSFPSLLPYMEYLPEAGTFMLEDGYSQALVYTVKPIATEGRSTERLVAKRNALQQIFQDTIDLKSAGSWIVQEYSYADPDLYELIPEIRKNMTDNARGSEYSEHYLGVMEKHLRGITNEEGIFNDDSVTNKPWRGENRLCKFVIYRRCTKHEFNDADHDPVEEITELREKLEMKFKDIGMKFERDDGKKFFNWMLHWFNPRSELAGGDRETLSKIAGCKDNQDLPCGYDLSESLVLNTPRPEPEKGVWWFDNLPHRFIRVARMANAPAIGQLTGEVKSDIQENGSASCFMDGLPSGSIVVKTMVLTPQTELDGHLNKLEGAAKGDSGDAQRTKEALNDLRNRMGRKQNVCRAFFGVYVRGENLKDLKTKTNQVITSLGSNNLTPYKATEDEMACGAYLSGLPMAFDPKYDTKHRLHRLCYTQHATNLSLLWGREEGSGKLANFFFNRAGTPLTFDMFKGGKDGDRKTNSHALVLGPTGAGKSAFLTYLSAQVMAMRRPRMFIVEVGNSFGLLGDYFKSHGLTVNRVQIKPGAKVSLPPFADSARIFDQEEAKGPEALSSLSEVIKDACKADGESDWENTDSVDSNEPDEDEQRDVMGEMETAAMLMVTGGEQREFEKYGRAERGLLREGIRSAARVAYDDNRQMLTEDLVNSMREIAASTEKTENLREQAANMAEALSTYCHEFEGELFNTEGEPWPETDVTIVDFATLAREGYEAQLAIAYISLMTKINNISEKYQFDERDNLLLTDESHIITTNPLLAAFGVKMVKTFRKLGTWAIYATQNLADFPDAAAKLLNMCEFWFMLVPEQDEIAQMSRFKPVTEEQKTMMSSATKQPRAYTEGVVLSKQLPEMLFRSVPPSLYLSLAMTEKDEKAERAQLMRTKNVSEVEAAHIVADNMDVFRGITKRPVGESQKAIA